MVTKQKILIVDDDENIAELISLYLTKECFDTMIVHDGEEALTAFESYQPNLMLLDLMLPGIDGYQVCREIRSKHNTPIIMLSAKGEVFDKVLGLELGADDYVLKPFDSKELVARVKAVLRRYQPAKPETPAASRGKVVDYPGIEINLTNYAVTVDGKNVFLSIDSRVTRHNPLYKAWKTKSFTDGDITLHFIVMDILSAGQELSLGDIAYQVDEYLSVFGHARVFDASTIRKKLNEYVKEGLLLTRKNGKTMLYRRAEEFEIPSRDVLDFFSETSRPLRTS